MQSERSIQHYGRTGWPGGLTRPVVRHPRGTGWENTGVEGAKRGSGPPSSGCNRRNGSLLCLPQDFGISCGSERDGFVYGRVRQNLTASPLELVFPAWELLPSAIPVSSSQ